MSELFQKFEVNSDPQWPQITKLIVVSLVFHASVLGMILYVPAVRDSVNIAALLSRTSYVDRAYRRTQIGEDVQVLEMAEKFRYPDGYFAPELQGEPVGDFPRAEIVADNSGRPREIAEALPSPSPSPEPSPSPALPTGSPTGTAVADADAANADKEKTDEVEQQLDQIATDNSVVRPSENEINIRPLEDWLKRANTLKVQGQLDLSSQIEITVAATLNTKCKLEDAKVVQKSGDSRLLDVAKDMVAAIGDSGMLSFLRDPQKVKDPNVLACDEIPLQLAVKMDQNLITATVESQAESAERAAEMAKGYSGLLAVGQLLKRGRDEEVLYKSTKVTSEDKRILVNFSMPRQTAGEMLKKKLPAS